MGHVGAFGGLPSPHSYPGHFRNFYEGCELLVCNLRNLEFTVRAPKPVQQETRSQESGC